MDYTIDTFRALSFDKLRTLHREIAALIAEKRSEALDSLRDQMASLGFTPADLADKKPKKTNGAKKYEDPQNPENTYAGKGPKPQWLKDALEEGRKLEEFAV